MSVSRFRPTFMTAAIAVMLSATGVVAQAGVDEPTPPMPETLHRGDDVLIPSRVVEAPSRSTQAAAPTVPGAERLSVTFATGWSPYEPVPSRYRPEVLSAASDLGEVLGAGPQVQVRVTVDPSIPDTVLGRGGAMYLVNTPDGCVTSSQYVGQGGEDLGGPHLQVLLSSNTEWWDEWGADPEAGVPVSLLYTTMLHEMVHGLGFGSRLHDVGGVLDFMGCGFDRAGLLTYDRLLQDRHGTPLSQLSSLARWSAATSSTTIAVGEGWPAFTPDSWYAGSSISHFTPELEVGGVMGPRADLDRFAVGRASLDVLAGLGWDPVAPPPAPTGLRATWELEDGRPGAVQLRWDSVAAATHGYTVEWVDASGEPRRTTTPLASVTIEDGRYTSASTMRLRVATNGVAARTWSDPVRVEASDPAGPDPTPTPAPDVDDGPPVTRPHGVSRLSGGSRYATAAAVSSAAFQTADTVLLATGTAFPDALAGAAVADRFDAPVLLTDRSRLPDETASELARLRPSRVLVLGGASAVTEAVAAAASDAAGGANLTRLSGGDRYATAAAVAAQVPPSGTVLLATGSAFPDALAGAGVAAGLDAPMLLTDRHHLPAATAQVLAEREPERVIVLGGSAAVSEEVAEAAARAAGGARVQRVSGGDRYATAAAVADLAEATPAILLATGRDFPDALAGAAVAARLAAPVLLTEPEWLPPPTADALVRRRVGSVTVLGGDAAVSPAVADALSQSMQ